MTAVVVGAARSGVALATYLVGTGERVRVVDRKSEAELKDVLEQLPAGVELQLGGYDDSVLAGVDVVYASPGVPWDSHLLNDARRRGIKVSSEIDLFLRLCPGTVVGITGTNGKTTTTELTGNVLRYVDLKARAIEFAGADDFAVLNGRDPAVRGLAARTRAQVVWFEEHRPLPPMPLPGRHNLENALAAAAVGRIAGLSDETIDEAIRSFKGVEHRLELVGEWDGVGWYNDSKATNPDAGRMALSAFPETPVVLIAGGYGGGFELGPWVADVMRHVDAVVLMGASADLLAKELSHHPKVVRASKLEEAVDLAAGLARPGGVVLLSPAYKSFDMFKDFEDRGRQFKALARRRFEK